MNKTKQTNRYGVQSDVAKVPDDRRYIILLLKRAVFDQTLCLPDRKLKKRVCRGRHIQWVPAMPRYRPSAAVHFKASDARPSCVCGLHCLVEWPTANGMRSYKKRGPFRFNCYGPFKNSDNKNKNSKKWTNRYADRQSPGRREIESRWCYPTSDFTLYFRLLFVPSRTRQLFSAHLVTKNSF